MFSRSQFVGCVDQSNIIPAKRKHLAIWVLSAIFQVLHYYYEQSAMNDERMTKIIKLSERNEAKKTKSKQ